MSTKLKIEFQQETPQAGRWFVVEESGYSPFNDFSIGSCEEFVRLVEEGRSYETATDWMWDNYFHKPSF